MTVAVAIPGYLVGIWKVDPAHSEIAFTVRHLMISRVRGRFTTTLDLQAVLQN